MSASQNENTAKSVAGQEGQVGSHVAPSEPMTTHGHQPGRQTGPAEFHVETLPAGSAPPSKTFEPGSGEEVPGQALNPDATATTGANDMPGSTSADVNTGIGKPIQGQSSKELRHDGQGHNTKQGTGLAAQGVAGTDAVKQGQEGIRVPLEGVDK